MLADCIPLKLCNYLEQEKVKQQGADEAKLWEKMSLGLSKLPSAQSKVAELQVAIEI